MKTLRIIFCDQLTSSMSSLQNINSNDVVMMCELMEEATYIKHHPKKIALWFASMRHFAEELIEQKINVRYIKLNDPKNTNTLIGEVKRAVDELEIEQIIVTEPSEYRLKKQVESWAEFFHIQVKILLDNRFLCNIDEFKNWAGNKKQLRMEYFYREMRKKWNILIDQNGMPIGGIWNYDKENRNPPNESLRSISRISHKKSLILQEVLELVKNNFANHFGSLEPFHYAINRKQALIELNHFIEYILPKFGDHQDAMVKGEAYLNHSLLSSYINIGLLLPLEVCKKAEEAYFKGKVSISSAEGFIRQILGWREYIRGIYWLKMPAYAEMNYFNAKEPLPEFFWGEKTKMACVKEVVSHTEKHAYSHHIQRLMVTGNFALIAGLDVKQVQEWYLAVYSDAYEWVEMPNTLGMALFGDGGVVASKPYASSGQYINKMSNFCKNCYYNVKEMVEDKACPFNSLYWNFLDQNNDKLKNNQRLGFVYNIWNKFDENKKESIRKKAIDIIKNIKKGLI